MRLLHLNDMHDINYLHTDHSCDTIAIIGNSILIDTCDVNVLVHCVNCVTIDALKLLPTFHDHSHVRKCNGLWCKVDETL